MRLRYWAEGPGGRSQVHMLGEWEESELLVEPVEQSVVLADTQQQARPLDSLFPCSSKTRYDVSGMHLARLSLLVAAILCFLCGGGIAAEFQVLHPQWWLPLLSAAGM